jgi:hypothetical protein
LWIINGNNLRFGWELARRVVRVRIDPGEASPDQRDSRKFVHEHLLSWVIKHRAKVIYHLLVLVKAWLADGRPGPVDETPGFGSFNSWREVVGGIMNTAGIPGFLLNLEAARQEADQESADIRAFMEMWQAEVGPGPVSATDLLPIGRRFFELPGSEHPATIRLGLVLSKYESQVHGGLRIQRMAQSRGKTQWVLQSVLEAAQ